MKKDSQIIKINDIISKNNKLDESLQIAIWEQFVKWSFFQFQSERHVYFGKIGHFGYKILEKNQSKIPFLFMEDEYIKKVKLVQKIKPYILKPLVRINYKAIVNVLLKDKLKKQEVQQTLQFIIQEIESIIVKIQIENVIIDMGIMGKLIRNNNQIKFQFVIPINDESKRYKRTTIRNIVQSKQKTININTKTPFFTGKDANKTKITFKKDQILKRSQSLEIRHFLQTESKQKQKITKLQNTDLSFKKINKKPSISSTKPPNIDRQIMIAKNIDIL